MVFSTKREGKTASQRDRGTYQQTDTCKRINQNLVKNKVSLYNAIMGVSVFFDFSLTVKAAPHKCVIKTGQP